MLDVAGRVIVVTGASRGLGAGMADEMAKNGARLGLCARGECQVPATASAADVMTAQVDVADERAVARFADAVVARFERIDLWINNAAVLEPVTFARDLDVTALMRHLTINVGGVANGTRAFVRHLRARGGEGVLVNITSGAALKGYAAWSAYCASKAAVDRLTECVDLEEGGMGLRAYAVAPGVIDTQMQSTLRALTPEQFPMVEKFRELKRTGAYNSPAYVARRILAVAFDPAERPDTVVLRLPEEPK